MEQLWRALKSQQRKKDDKLWQKYNVVLLGAAGSGTSTLMKQLDIACNHNKFEKGLEMAKEDIYRSILIDIYDLCKYNIHLNSMPDSQQNVYKLSSPELIDNCHRISAWASQFILEDPTLRLTQQVCQDIAQLWADKGMKETWRVRSKNHHMDNTPYYLDDPARFIQDDYTPSYEDYLKYRDQTTGIVVTNYEINDEMKVQVTDAGGTRAERRKWLKLFDNIHLVIYMTQLTGYCQNLYEDHNKNRLDEELQLFSKTMSLEAFAESEIMLIFTKYDLFEEKLKEIPFTEYVSDFNELDASNPDKVYHYIRNEYMKRFEQVKRNPNATMICIPLNLIKVPLNIGEYRDYCVDVKDDKLLVFGFCKYKFQKSKNQKVKRSIWRRKQKSKSNEDEMREMRLPTDVIYIVYRYYYEPSVIKSLLNALGRKF